MRATPYSVLLVSLVCLSFACGDDSTDTSATAGDSGSTSATTTTTTTTTTTAATTTTTMGTDSGATGPDTTGSTGMPTFPEIDVSIDMTPIASGDPYDFVDTVDVGMMGTAATVTIANMGTGDLNVSGVSIAAGDGTHFALDAAAVEPVVAPAASTSFTVAFAPQNGGIKAATVRIDSDDADEAAYDLLVNAHSTANTFRDITAMVSPPARFNAKLVDVQDGRLLLFGGRDATGTLLNDTWTYDIEAGTWTQLMPMTPPSPRNAHAMAYVGNDTVILFGGSDAGGGGALGDTWSFDTVTSEWAARVVAMPPTPRFQAAMVSIGPDLALLHGGRATFGLELSETWVYDAASNTWANAAPTGDPGPRSAFALGFDGAGTVTRFGGFDSSAPMDDTWHYSVMGNAWTQAAPTTTPGLRAALSGAYFANGRFVVHSGKLGSCCVDPSPGTFSYDATADDWTDLAPATEPAARFNYAMAYVGGANKAILFAGLFRNVDTTSATTDTFEYVGARP